LLVESCWNVARLGKHSLVVFDMLLARDDGGYRYRLVATTVDEEYRLYDRVGERSPVGSDTDTAAVIRLYRPSAPATTSSHTPCRCPI
jgi:hypothetical protein